MRKQYLSTLAKTLKKSAIQQALEKSVDTDIIFFISIALAPLRLSSLSMRINDSP